LSPFLGAFLLLLCSLFVTGCDLSRGWPRDRFDPRAWALASPGDRFRYVRELRESRRLEGLTREQVIALLGEPTFNPPGAPLVEYVVGLKKPRPFSLGTVVVLQIDFEAGKVSRTWLRAE
jgi:hypothetical protein